MHQEISEYGILRQISEAYDHLSRSHKKIADYILQNSEAVPMMSATQMAKTVSVSEATVVRFAVYFGFDGYPEFKRRLKDEISSTMTALDRIDMVMTTPGASTSGMFHDILKSDIQSMRETLNVFDEQVFENAVDAIINSRKVIVVGFHTSSVLTQHLGHYLRLLRDGVIVINGLNDLYEQTIRADESDTVIALSFPRYSRTTYDVISVLKDKGTSVISLTDSPYAPIVQFSDYALIAKSNVNSFVDSLTAPLSMIDALIVAVGNRNLERTKKTFNELEKMYQKNDVYAVEVMSNDKK